MKPEQASNRLHSHQLLKVFISVLAAFSALALLNFVAQLHRGTPNSTGNVGIAGALLISTFLAAHLRNRDRHDAAALAVIVGLMLAGSTPMWLFQTGVRAPAMLLPVIVIGLAHFQWGPDRGRQAMLAGVALWLLTFWLESSGRIPGTDGERYPPLTNAIVIISGVLTLCYLTAHELQARSERSLAGTEAQNLQLEASIARSERNRQSQTVFFSQITETLLTDCKHLADLCDELADAADRRCADTPAEDISTLLSSTRFMTDQVVAQFEKAVSSVENDLDVPRSQV